MAERETIGVFYSKGRTFASALRCIRAARPGAALTAIVPEGYPVCDEERCVADAFLEIGKGRYGLKDVGALARLTGFLRVRRFDAFVILFDSPKLRVLSALVGAGERLFCRMDGKLLPVRQSIPGTTVEAVARALWGRLVYAALWMAIRVTRVPGERNGAGR